MALLSFNENGIYCRQADVYIDPWRPVKKALITHAHADHARQGSEQYLAHHDSIPVMRHRLGAEIEVQGIGYGEPVRINQVIFSFHPAGHIPGSAQIRAEYKGEVWVVSGDYKLEDDGLSAAFQPVSCHHFITESTFGLPVYTWKPQQLIFNDIDRWWAEKAAAGKACLVGSYSLGKAQRLLQGVDAEIGPIYTHGAVENMNEVLRAQGYTLPFTQRVDAEMKKSDFKGALIVAPPSALGTPWARKLGPHSTAFCSGWMALRGARRRRAADRGFVLSDHADWQGLNQAVKDSQAENIYVTHGYKDIYARFLREEWGLNAQPVDTLYEGESVDSDD